MNEDLKNTGNICALEARLDQPGAVEMEIVDNCPLCGSDRADFMFWNYDRLYHLPGRFGTWKCADCELVRLSPRPTREAIAQYYPEDYGAHVTPDSLNGRENKGFKGFIKRQIRGSVLFSLGYTDIRTGLFIRLLAPVLRKRFFSEAAYGYGERFPNFVPGGTALEVGCGNALYLSFLKTHGWAVTGVDLSENAASKAREAFGINVIVGEVEESGLTQESFDYIHLSHVVEHFFDPVKAMTFIAGLLKPKGVLYMEVPNAKGIRAETNREYWYGWDAPRHLVMFSPDNGQRLLQRCGLTVTKLSTGLSDTSHWEVLYEQESVTGTLRPDRPQLNEEEKATAARRASEAVREFAARPDRGDFIACWATKL